MGVTSDPERAPFPTLTGDGARRLAAGSQRIVIVGAGGWLGLATLEALHGLFGDHLSDRVVCFGSSARTLILRGGVKVEQRALADLSDLPPAPGLVLHLAFLTQEKAKLMSDSDYVATNAAITGAVLGALDGIGADGVFVASSGAVYMADQPGAEASKRLYGRLKLKDEVDFTRWAISRRKRAVISRIFNVSGPYVNKHSSYALACFIADALAGRPIVIQAARPVLRSYVAISELMSVVFGALTDGEEDVTLFDTAGDRVYEMADIAAVVAHTLDHAQGVERPVVNPASPDRYVGDASVYCQLRHRFAVEVMDFPAQVLETARFMAEFIETV